MKDDSWAPYGAAAGAIGVGLFLAGSSLTGDRPGFDASGAEVAANLDEHRTRIQVGCALLAATGPFFIWFFSTIASLTRDREPRSRRAGLFVYGCGLVFVALFMVDITTLAVAALRPENMASVPELASTLRDVEFLLMGSAALTVAALLLAIAVLVLRHGAIWPNWIGWFAAVAAPAYALRVGTLFTTDGGFAADGLYGLWIPVVAVASWVFVASAALALRIRMES